VPRALEAAAGGGASGPPGAPMCVDEVSWSAMTLLASKVGWWDGGCQSCEGDEEWARVCGLMRLVQCVHKLKSVEMNCPW
jgi:hypothetical protein